MWGVSPEHNCTAHDCHDNYLWNLVHKPRKPLLPSREVIERMQECLASLIRQSEDAEEVGLQLRPNPILYMPSWNFMSNFTDFLHRAGICVRHVRPFVSKAEDGGIYVQWVDFMDQQKQTFF
jgi:hypothetical protein